MWVQPTDEELFKKYNPELQKKSLERRYEKQKEFDDFVVRLKEYSKSDKPSMRYPTTLHRSITLATTASSMLACSDVPISPYYNILANT
jgi:hypothetical protein